MFMEGRMDHRDSAMLLMITHNICFIEKLENYYANTPLSVQLIISFKK